MNHITPRKSLKIIYILLFTAVTGIFLFMLRLYYPSAAASDVLINEICSNNFSVVSNGSENYPDYVELYNPTSADVFMDGFYLSDSRDSLQKYSLEGITIPAGGYALVFLDQDETENPEALRLSRDGDEVFLSDSHGNMIDSVTLPALSYNTCYARIRDGQDEWSVMSATAGESNHSGVLAKNIRLDSPVFSAENGFYDEPFELSVTNLDSDNTEIKIYYTLDGSEPDNGSLLYDAPIQITDRSPQENLYITRSDLSTITTYTPEFPVDKATVVRAVCYDPETNAYSDVVTKVYFTNFDQKAEYDGFPVISIVTDPDNLFDMETGIYGSGQAMEDYKAAGGLQDGQLLAMFVDEEGFEHHKYGASNAFNGGKEWEREAVFTFFDEEHSLCFSQNVGIRISGQSSRSAGQKSFNIYGRDIYDETITFPYSFFENTSYSTIKIRNGGSDHSKSKIKDAFLQFLASERDVAVQDSSPCVVFLNGEYWGLYNLRERYKEEYLENHYNVNQSNVWIIDSGHANVGGDDAQSAYEYMVDYISEVDMTLDVHYENTESLIDIQSLIDYYCINLYVDNQDMSFIKNMGLWRTSQSEADYEYGDCRWRWMLFDMDISMNSYDYNTFQHSADNTGLTLMNEPVIKSLMRNEQFRECFYNTFIEIATTTFSYERVHEELMKWKEQYETQVIKSQQCFNSADFDQEDFDSCIMEIDEFFKNRYSYAVEYLEQEMEKYEN